MRRNRFYNRRLASRAPVLRSALSGDPWPDTVGNPPAFDFEDVPTPGVSAFVPVTAPDHLAVIQPPAAHVLDGTVPASGRSATTGRAFTRGGENAAAFSAGGRSAELTL